MDGKLIKRNTLKREADSVWCGLGNPTEMHLATGG